MLMLSHVVEANSFTAFWSRLDLSLGVELFKIVQVNGKYACLYFVKKWSVKML